MRLLPPPHFKPFLLIPLGVLLLWSFFAIIGVLCLGTKPDPLQYTGWLGDSFGSLNALYSGVAMSGAIYAVVLQTWQISDQKKHDRDMFRREKLEKVVLDLTAMRHTLSVITDKINDALSEYLVNAQITQSPPAPIRFGLAKGLRPLAQDLLSLSTQTFSLYALYFEDFKGSSKAIPNAESFMENVIKPLEKLIDSDSEQTMLERLGSYALPSVEYHKEVGDCILYITKNVDEIVSFERVKENA